MPTTQQRHTRPTICGRCICNTEKDKKLLASNVYIFTQHNLASSIERHIYFIGITRVDLIQVDGS